MKLKKGDMVKIIIGKDKGRTGKVQKIITKNAKIIIDGINIYKKHVKKSEGKPGGIIEISRPLAVSKVMIICPTCNKPARIGYQIIKNGEKTRICRKCKAII